MFAENVVEMTEGDYFALDERTDVRHEYIDGYVYAMSGGTLDHDTIGGNLRALLRTSLHRSGCRIQGPDARTRLQEGRYVYPDTVITCDPSDRGSKTYLESPRVVCEVLSVATERYDLGKKLAYYQACPHVQDYLLISTKERHVELYHRSEDLWTYNSYTQSTEDSVIIESLGLTIHLPDIYEDTDVP